MNQDHVLATPVVDLKALANEDTLLPTQMFPLLPVCNISCRHKFCVRDTRNVSEFVQKHFVSAKMFPSLRSPTNIMGNNVSATMCPRLPGPLRVDTTVLRELSSRQSET